MYTELHVNIREKDDARMRAHAWDVRRTRNKHKRTKDDVERRTMALGFQWHGKNIKSSL